jgi:anti-anti-sigma factor
MSEAGDLLQISIKGRFDFSSHQEFRDAYEDKKPDTAYEIDMQETTYLDSSALGMLLLLRDHAGGDESKIKIVNCNDDVRKILTISNFEQLFEIQ